MELVIALILGVIILLKVCSEKAKTSEFDKTQSAKRVSNNSWLASVTNEELEQETTKYFEYVENENKVKKINTDVLNTSKIIDASGGECGVMGKCASIENAVMISMAQKGFLTKELAETAIYGVNGKTLGTLYAGDTYTVLWCANELKKKGVAGDLYAHFVDSRGSRGMQWRITPPLNSENLKKFELPSALEALAPYREWEAHNTNEELEKKYEERYGPASLEKSPELIQELYDRTTPVFAEYGPKYKSRASLDYLNKYSYNGFYTDIVMAQEGYLTWFACHGGYEAFGEHIDEVKSLALWIQSKLRESGKNVKLKSRSRQYRYRGAERTCTTFYWEGSYYDYICDLPKL